MSFTILGTGKAVPEYVLTNEELSTMVETNDEWILAKDRTRPPINKTHPPNFIFSNTNASIYQ